MCVDKKIGLFSNQFSLTRWRFNPKTDRPRTSRSKSHTPEHLQRCISKNVYVNRGCIVRTSHNPAQNPEKQCRDFIKVKTVHKKATRIYPKATFCLKTGVLADQEFIPGWAHTQELCVPLPNVSALSATDFYLFVCFLRRGFSM